jgi:hypothetical protein
MANLDITGQPTKLLTYGLSNDYSSLNWSYTSVVFTAAAPVTTLQMTSLNPGDAGMYLGGHLIGGDFLVDAFHEWRRGNPLQTLTHDHC